MFIGATPNAYKLKSYSGDNLAEDEVGVFIKNNKEIPVLPIDLYRDLINQEGQNFYDFVDLFYGNPNLKMTSIDVYHKSLTRDYIIKVTTLSGTNDNTHYFGRSIGLIEQFIADEQQWVRIFLVPDLFNENLGIFLMTPYDILAMTKEAASYQYPTFINYNTYDGEISSALMIYDISTVVSQYLITDRDNDVRSKYISL